MEFLKAHEREPHYYGSFTIFSDGYKYIRVGDARNLKSILDSIEDKSRITIKKTGSISKSQLIRQFIDYYKIEGTEDEQIMAATELFDMLVDSGALIENGKGLREYGNDHVSGAGKFTGSRTKLTRFEGVTNSNAEYYALQYLIDHAQTKNDRLSINGFKWFLYVNSDTSIPFELINFNDFQWLERHVSNDAYNYVISCLNVKTKHKQELMNHLEFTRFLLKSFSPISVFHKLNRKYRMKIDSKGNVTGRKDEREKPNHQKIQDFSRADLWRLIDRAKKSLPTK